MTGRFPNPIGIRPHIGLAGEMGTEPTKPPTKGGGFGHTINVSAPITINGPVADQGNLSAVLTEHAREIAR